MIQKKIAVLMGGPSAEREVSLNTGKAIQDALTVKGYEVVGIDLEPARFMEQINESGAEIVFNAVHGLYGEDGAVQGALDMAGVPYTGSGVSASAIAMDKAICKQLFTTAGIPTARYRILTDNQSAESATDEIIKEFALPVVVKATTQGSSIGVYIVEEKDALTNAVREAFSYSRRIVVEEFIKGRELTVAVIAGNPVRSLPIIEIAPHSGRYDYQSKYTKGATEYIVPALLTEGLTVDIQKTAADVFNLIGCNGVARVDMILDADNRYFVLEINTIPGMTATSLVPKAAAAAGISFPDLCEQLLLAAIAE
ncbi:D-alanine--D-alanine ligase [Anaerosporomusa subterranea]|uniref:D-alanine--D-alanine ligase n=1 Tax=Anaerosporomusa subterranea TaxID=1794912 RepID=A0A154BUC1_ANASB|nr:D-alanine--D-alanine ligase [Anaerosporomusa subterranea]KYZ77108.1 D-alanine--D-alanine ligase [Anaerosporomusa subterranea]